MLPDFNKMMINDDSLPYRPPLANVIH